jgi:hypothetical protein
LPTLNANPDPYIDSTWGQTAREIKTIINFYTVLYVRLNINVSKIEVF